MEALIYGGHRICVHLCLLFNLFITSGYLPVSFMHCAILPLVKNKGGDLSDLNNYRAIAVSSAVSKLFESVIACYFESTAEVDKYQFGFKPGHSTSLCTSVFKQTLLVTIETVVAMCLSVLLISIRRLTLLIIGSCLISSWMIIFTLILLNCLLFTRATLC